MDEDSRKKMDNFLREIEGQFPAKVCSLNRMENLFIQQKLLGGRGRGKIKRKTINCAPYCRKRLRKFQNMKKKIPLFFRLGR